MCCTGIVAYSHDSPSEDLVGAGVVVLDDVMAPPLPNNNNNNNFICIAHQITYCLMALNNASKQYKKQG